MDVYYGSKKEFPWKAKTLFLEQQMWYLEIKRMMK